MRLSALNGLALYPQQMAEMKREMQQLKEQAAVHEQRQRENEQARSADPPSHPRSPQNTLLLKLHRAHTTWAPGSFSAAIFAFIPRDL